MRKLMIQLIPLERLLAAAKVADVLEVGLELMYDDENKEVDGVSIALWPEDGIWDWIGDMLGALSVSLWWASCPDDVGRITGIVATNESDDSVRVIAMLPVVDCDIVGVVRSSAVVISVAEAMVAVV